MCLAGNANPGVITASPVLIGASFSQADLNSETPAALNMAPQTPPPHSQFSICRINYHIYFHFCNILFDYFQGHRATSEKYSLITDYITKPKNT